MIFSPNHMDINLNEEASLCVTVSTIFIAIACVAMFGCSKTEDSALEALREKEKTVQEAMKNGLVQKPESTSTTFIWTKP